MRHKVQAAWDSIPQGELDHLLASVPRLVRAFYAIYVVWHFLFRLEYIWIENANDFLSTWQQRLITFFRCLDDVRQLKWLLFLMFSDVNALFRVYNYYKKSLFTPYYHNITSNKIRNKWKLQGAPVGTLPVNPWYIKQIHIKKKTETSLWIIPEF